MSFLKDLFLGRKPPKAPDYTPLAEAQEKYAEYWFEIAKDQMGWAKENAEWAKEMFQDMWDIQLPMMQFNYETALADRERWEEVAIPLRDDLIEEFKTFDTEWRREQEASQRAADVAAAFEANSENLRQMLAGKGFTAQATREAALDRPVAAKKASEQVLAKTQGRNYIEQMGRALRGEAINIESGLPAQVAQTQGIINQTAGVAGGNYGNYSAGSSNLFNTGLNAGNMAMQGGMNSAGIQNMQYGNQYDRWLGQEGQRMSTLEMLGGAVGFANTAGWIAEGGKVPEDLSSVPNTEDKYPAMLAKDEYVVPADVVRKKGTEFFDKLLEKYRDGGEYEQKKQGVKV